MHMNNILLKHRIIAAVSIIVFLMICVTAFTYWGLTKVKAGYEQAINYDYKQSLAVRQIHLLTAQQQMFLTNSILLGTKGDAQEYQRIAREVNNQLNDLKASSPQANGKIDALAQAVRETQVQADRAKSILEMDKAEEAINILMVDFQEAAAQQSAILDELSNQANGNVRESVQRAQRAASNTALVIYTIILIAISAAIGIAILIIRNITIPLNQIADITRSIAEGDLSIDLPANNDKTEIGALNASFRDLIESLREITIAIEHISQGNLKVEIKPRSQNDTLAQALKDMVKALYDIAFNVKKSSSQVKEISGNLTFSSKQLASESEMAASATQSTASTVEQLSINIQGIAKNVETQSANVTETTTAIKRIAHQMEAIAESTKNLSVLSRTAHNVVQNGRKSVDTASSGMREIDLSINTTADTIKELSERVLTIEKIVEVINTISDQTNLLALNAAIEAARAGQQGLGFGVVAEEIRKLSDRTAKSVDEISDLIVGIQEGVSQVTTQMSRSTRLVKDGLGQSANVVEVLEHIEKVVGTVATTANDIDQIVIEQTAGTTQVLEATEQLYIITQEIQAASMEQASATKEIVHSIEKVSNSAERNTNLAEQLSTTSRMILNQAEQLDNAVKVFRLNEAVMVNTLQPANVVMVNSAYTH